MRWKKTRLVYKYTMCKVSQRVFPLYVLLLQQQLHWNPSTEFSKTVLYLTDCLALYIPVCRINFISQEFFFFKYIWQILPLVLSSLCCHTISIHSGQNAINLLADKKKIKQFLSLLRKRAFLIDMIKCPCIFRSC